MRRGSLRADQGIDCKKAKIKRRENLLINVKNLGEDIVTGHSFVKQENSWLQSSLAWNLEAPFVCFYELS